MCVTKRLKSTRPAGPCQGNIPLLSALLTKQNCSTVKSHYTPPVCQCVCQYECVCLSTGRRWSVTAWSLGPWRVMERGRASCSIWSHGWTQKEKENTEEKQCQCTTRVVSKASITARPVLTPPYFSHHQPRYTKKWQVVYGLLWHLEEDNEMSANFSGVMDRYE